MKDVFTFRKLIHYVKERYYLLFIELSNCYWYPAQNIFLKNVLDIKCGLMHKKLHIWFYEWLAFIVNFYIIVVGMYFIEYMKLNLVLNDRILVLLNVLTRTDCLRWFVTPTQTKPCMPEQIVTIPCHDLTPSMSQWFYSLIRLWMA